MRQRHRLVFVSLVITSAVAALAATPPGLINHQGVLRDASDRPLSGTYDMTFRFYDAAVAGNEILVDAHTAGGGSAVVVSGGLFDVALGGGTVSDGSGPGTYTALADLFRDHGAVHMSIQVGAETLSPRVRIVAAAYALNATNFAGRAAGDFLDTSAATQTKGGRLVCQGGLEGRGTSYGGYFADSDGTGYAYLGIGNDGITSYGTSRGGYFADLDSTGRALVAYGDYGVSAYGSTSGGYFYDSADSGYALCGYADYGVWASGNTSGGYFRDRDGSGEAYAGWGDEGIVAQGNVAGGRFNDLDQSGYARVASGDTGIFAQGNSSGGQFEDADSSGLAYVGYGNSGITAQGSDWGGRFEDTDGSGVAWVGYSNTGVWARGNSSGGHFEDNDHTGVAECGYGDYGLHGTGTWGVKGAGTTAGVLGEDSDNAGYGYLGYADSGVLGHGTFQGGYFVDDDSSGYARAGYGAYKIFGSGTVSFVQNHPTESAKVIVYAAPEGDEVATYTRGSARLVAGEARVVLGETFAWVTNPDVGLTVHVTPVGDWSDLYVAEKSTREILVRSRGGAPDAAFDYVVYGLRIGFEEISIVQEKDHESFIPSMADHRALYARQPELRRFSALERHLAMAREVRGTPAVDLAGALALKAAVQEYDPAVHGPVAQLMGRETGARLAEPEGAAARVGAAAAAPRPAAPEPLPPRVGIAIATVPAGSSTPAGSEGTAVASVLLPVSEPVEAGDVLVVDPDRRGALRRARLAADPGVVGVAVGPSQDGLAPVATYGVVTCKVDAAFAPIAAGDLLAAAPTPGHAMRAGSRDPGTIVGKALEPLDVGAGTILVLVMPR